MKRIQLFEFEDFNWFPKSIRTSMTNLIVVLLDAMKIPQVLAHEIEKKLKEAQLNTIVDMGSGSGGAMPAIYEELQNNSTAIDITLTDKFPNPKIIDSINSLGKKGLTYHNESVDATELASAPKGLKTMINSFHHMKKEQARSILKSATENEQHFLIYELNDNSMPTIVWWIFLPISLVILSLMTLFMTPFSKNITWQQIVFTYIFPVIPFCYAWDGQASLPRIYTPDDIAELTKDLNSEKYQWTTELVKDEKGKKKGMITYGKPI